VLGFVVEDVNKAPHYCDAFRIFDVTAGLTQGHHITPLTRSQRISLRLERPGIES